MWDLPNPGIKPMSSALAGGFLPLSHQESPKVCFLFNSRLSWLGLHCFEGFSLAATSGDYSLVTMYGLLSAVVSLVSAHGLSSCRFSCLVAYVGSSRSRDQTHVPALAGKLNHWTTREVLPTLHCWEIALGSSLHVRPGQNHFLWDVCIFFVTTTFLIYADKLTSTKCLWLPI